jgi:membrane dipeptidase
MHSNRVGPVIPVFDGHNDVLGRAFDNARFDFIDGTETYHMDLSGALEAGFAGGLFAIFIPPNQAETQRARSFTGDLSTPGTVPLARAQRAAAAMFSQLHRYIERSHGGMALARSAHDLNTAFQSGTVTVVCHMEGAEAIDDRFRTLDLYYDAGLRSLGITWSRSNRFGCGVPFGHNRSPDIGPGLSRAGKDLVRRCNELGVMVDVSHLNAQGFWDVVRTSGAPIVASHSNAWGISPSTRNLTDDQLAAIRDTDGLVGLNFGVPYLRPDGHLSADTPLTRMREHLEYLAERVGIDRVGLGSDFDGVEIPRELGSVRGLPKLMEALSRWGYSAEEIRGIAHRNWIRVLTQTWR